MKRLFPWTILLIFFLLLGQILHSGKGTYNTSHILQLTTVFGIWLGSFFFKTSPRAFLSDRLLRMALTLIIFFQTCFLARDTRIAYPDSLVMMERLEGLVDLMPWIAGGLLLLTFLQRGRAWILPLSSSLLFLLILVHGLTISSSSQPRIDVFTSNTLAVQYWLEGQNPYSASYPDLYHGEWDYEPGLVYWPGLLLSITPFQLLFQDIRWTFFFALIGIAGMLLYLAGRVGWGLEASLLFPLTWLSFPVSLFVLEQAWIDTLLIFFASLSLVFFFQKRPVWMGVALGFFCSLKQYSVFFALITLAVLLFRSTASERRFGWKTLAATAITFFGLMTPFILWDPHAFYHRTFEVPLHQAARLDSLSLYAFFANRLDWFLTSQITLAIYFSTLAASLYWVVTERSHALWKIPMATTFTYGVIFLLGKQAFCNYYYFLSFFLLLGILSFKESRQGEHPKEIRIRA